MADSTYNAAVQITAQYNGEQAIRRASSDISSLAKNVSQLKNLWITQQVLKAAGEFVQFSKSVIDLGDHIQEMSQKSGIGHQAILDLKAAAEDGGVEIGDLESQLKRFSVTVAKAGSGAHEAQSAFGALGINVKDARGNLKATDELLLEVADVFSKAEDGAGKAAVATAIFGRSGADLIPVLNKGREGIKGLGAQMSEQFIQESDKFNDKLNELHRTTVSLSAAFLEKLLPALTSVIEKLNEGLKSGAIAKWSSLLLPAPLKAMFGIGLSIAESAANSAASKGKDYGVQFGPPGPPKNKINFVDPGVAQAYQHEHEAVEKLLAQKRELASLNELEAQKLSLSTAEYEKQKIALEENLRADRELVSFKSAQEKAAYRAATAEIIKQKQALIDLQEEQKKSFGAGAQQALKEWLESGRNVAAQSKQLFLNAFQGMEDALVKFVQTGKLSFADLAASIQADLIRIAVRQSLVFGISSAIGAFAPAAATAGGAGAAGLSFTPTPGFAMGGIMTGAGPVSLRRYAGGGVARSPQMALFGEGSRPEAYVPLPDGRSIPVSMNGGGPNVTVNVNIQSDGTATSAAGGDSARGNRLGRAISAAVTEEIIKQKRPGGLLA